MQHAYVHFSLKFKGKLCYSCLLGSQSYILRTIRKNYDRIIWRPWYTIILRYTLYRINNINLYWILDMIRTCLVCAYWSISSQLCPSLRSRTSVTSSVFYWLHWPTRIIIETFRLKTKKNKECLSFNKEVLISMNIISININNFSYKYYTLTQTQTPVIIPQ